MRRIIIHYPFKILNSRKSASQIRPMRILNAFKQLNYQVDLIEGYGKERSVQIKEISKAINNGVKYDFVYSESSTMPTLLTEKHHYPVYPLLDFGFFKLCRKHGIPIGLFYRDIYWCFPKHNPTIQERVARWFYRYDIRRYNALVNHLFVPSVEMVKYLPDPITIPISELYPGCDIEKDLPQPLSDVRKLNILYVGGIGSHYDLSLFMQVVKNIPDVHFTLCCRPEDWNPVKELYEPYLVNGNISVVHKNGAELRQLYADADLFCLFVEPDKYWEFAVPFKLFETVGYAKPVIASAPTWVARFVSEQGTGLVCSYAEEELRVALQMLVSNRGYLNQYKHRVKDIQLEHTWEARCQTIVKALSK